MDTFFASLVIGHLVGDYLLQNKWMAMNKSANSMKCMVHCILYTIAVYLISYRYIHGILWIMIIFLSHFPIDRWGIADKWLKLINGRSLEDYLTNGKTKIPHGVNIENYHALRGGFTALVYALADNTLHLIIMYYGAIILNNL